MNIYPQPLVVVKTAGSTRLDRRAPPKAKWPGAGIPRYLKRRRISAIISARIILSDLSRILFVTTNRIGDAVLSSGVIDHLRNRHPSARFTIACGALPAALFADLPGLERIHVMKRKPKGAHWLDLWRSAIGTNWRVIADVRGSMLAWTLIAGQRLVCRTQSKREHRVEEIGRSLGIVPAPAPGLWVSESRQRQVDAALGRQCGPILAVAPTANWAPKQWPVERFADAVGILAAPDGILPGARIAVLGAASEREMARPLVASLPSERVFEPPEDWDLLDTFAALRRADFFIGNDSGLMHMAAAAGIPTLGLFGPSPEWRYGPFGPNCAAVRTKESFEELVSENPTFDHRRQDCLMTGLSVEAAVEAARALWHRTAPDKT